MIEVYDNFVEKEYCNSIIEYGKSFKENPVKFHEFQNNVIKKTIRNIERFLSLSIDKSHFIYYNIGDRLGRHKDLGGPFINRKLTAIIYLNDVQVGGETRIYDTEKIIDVVPQTGKMAVYSSYLEHEGLPPVSNKKYIMTAWMV